MGISKRAGVARQRALFPSCPVASNPSPGNRPLAALEREAWSIDGGFSELGSRGERATRFRRPIVLKKSSPCLRGDCVWPAVRACPPRLESWRESTASCGQARVTAQTPLPPRRACHENRSLEHRHPSLGACPHRPRARHAESVCSGRSRSRQRRPRLRNVTADRGGGPSPEPPGWADGSGREAAAAPVAADPISLANPERHSEKARMAPPSGERRRAPHPTVPRSRRLAIRAERVSMGKSARFDSGFARSAWSFGSRRPPDWAS